MIARAGCLSTPRVGDPNDRGRLDRRSCRAGRAGWVLLAGLPILSTLGSFPGAALGRSDERAPGAEEADPGAEWQVPIDEATASAVDSLIPLLSSPKPVERDEAAKRLVEIGPAALSKLRDAYLATQNLEARMRIEEVVREAYLAFHVFNRNAFLGIQQAQVPVMPSEEPRIPAGQVGIRVDKVLKDTAAEAAGVEAEDIIVAFDGHALHGVGPQAVQEFVERIRNSGPGASVTLSVLRKTEQRDIVATLRPRPRQYYFRQGPITQLLVEHEQRFLAWWDRHFRGKDADGRPAWSRE